ncbi:MAG: hypothetical protein WC325_13555 [Candidatus Bathyarchaeia archaeon]
MQKKSVKSKKQLTCKKARYFRADENKSAKEYREYGYPKLGKDEASHAKVFDKFIKDNCP